MFTFQAHPIQGTRKTIGNATKSFKKLKTLTRVHNSAHVGHVISSCVHTSDLRVFNNIGLGIRKENYERFVFRVYENCRNKLLTSPTTRMKQRKGERGRTSAKNGFQMCDSTCYRPLPQKYSGRVPYFNSFCLSVCNDECSCTACAN